jgi:glycosyltransferase involved in cell wall biosynthesis
MIILTICIPTLPDRLHHLNNMMAQLTPQLTDEVQVLTDDRSRTVPTGVKRNDMYFEALGQYVCSVDDDDEISSVYISELLKYIKEHKTDCVTFNGWMTTNGAARVDWSIKLGEKYEARKDDDGVTRYYRFPNHLVPIKKSIAVQVKFPPITQGEDYAWACKIQPFLKTSVHIPLQLYHYKFITRK